MALIAGILIGGKLPLLFIQIPIGIIGAVFAMYKHKIKLIIGLLFSIVALGCFIMQSEVNDQNMKRKLALELHDQSVLFVGDVKAIGTTAKGFKYLIILHRYRGIGVWFYSENELQVELGDTLIGRGEFQIIDAARNPGEFDFQSYNNRKNIYGWIFPEQPSQIEIAQNNSWSLSRKIFDFRNNIRKIFRIYTPEISRGLLSALILGDKSDVGAEIHDAFAKTGVIHVLAVSGLHVGYVLFLLLMIKNMFRLPWGIDRIVIIIGLGFFVILTGGKASVIRAAVMAGLYVLAPVVNRQRNIWNIISCAAFVILCVRPTDIYDMGFQLSFVAVISIIFFYNWFEKILPQQLKVSTIQNKGLKFIWGLFLVSFAAQLGTLPLTAHVFGKIPIISLIANVIIVPLIGLLVGVGFLILLLFWLPMIGSLLGNAAWSLAQIITYLTNYFSSVSFASFDSYFSWSQVVIYYTSVLIVILISHKEKLKYGIICSLILINVLLWSWVVNKNELQVVFLDVGQGDAALLILPDQKVMLVDAGQRNLHEDYGQKVIIPALDYFGINKINWIVMSHPHSDHIGGVVTVLENVRVDTLWDSFIPYSSLAYSTILSTAAEKGTTVIRPKQGEIKKLSPNLYAQIFAPDSLVAVSQYNVNNASIVFKLVYGETSILFTGDLEHEGDDLLLPYKDLLSADVLKVAHHGSVTSTTSAFLSHIAPNIAIISVGWKNKFSHPSLDVINRLESNNIDIHRTDLHRALWLKSDGKKFKKVRWNL